jgi:hypothetical protein
MDRDTVTQLLKNYRSYRYAVNNGIAPFVEDDLLGMPRSLSYGSRLPTSLSGRGTTHASQADYHQYKRIVQLIDGAVSDVLSDDEQKVIRLKYMERNPLTLAEIGHTYSMCDRKVTYLHKRSLRSLSLALAFVDVPDIINLDKHIERVTI